MVVLIDAKKAFDKIQDLFTIKAFNKLDIEGNFLSQLKGVCGRTQS